MVFSTPLFLFYFLVLTLLVYYLVPRKYRNLVLPIAQIREITWKQILFPVATFHMAGGEDYVFLIFNKSRFTACFEELRGTN